MFELDRIFSQRNAETGLVEWFFSAREGVLGPFFSKEHAAKELKSFADLNIKINDDGGRSPTSNVKMSLAPLDDSMNTVKLDDTKSERGKDG